MKETQIWVDDPKQLEEKIHIKFFDMGMAVNHNLMCWLCNERPAVYSMHPNWVFKPCWECQKNIEENQRQEKVNSLAKLIMSVLPFHNCYEKKFEDTPTQGGRQE